MGQIASQIEVSCGGELSDAGSVIAVSGSGIYMKIEFRIQYPEEVIGKHKLRHPRAGGGPELAGITTGFPPARE